MIMRRWLHFAFGVSMCVLCLGCAPARGTVQPALRQRGPSRPSVDPDQAAISAVLNDVEQAMEQRDVYRVLGHVSASYRDKTDRTYTDLRRFLQRIFENYAAIEVARSGSRIVMDKNRAAVTEEFVTFARGEPEATVNPLTVRGQVSVFLEKIAGTWLIVEWGEKP